ncbi:MAG: hypothetical protein K9W44_01305 [Candidatus Lokiarchaeota archaeon]|nr:hypothetical protein [Candidatus Harpocratesius repetitus]
MSDKTTIQIKKTSLELLKQQKSHPRETYDEVIRHLIAFYTNSKKNNQYDEFLHKIQQMKMKELWDNDEDAAWENY